MSNIKFFLQCSSSNWCCYCFLECSTSKFHGSNKNIKLYSKIVFAVLARSEFLYTPSQRFRVFFFFSGKESNDILFVSLIIFIIDVTNKDSLASIKQSTDYLPIEYFMGRLLFIGMLNHNVYCTVLVFTVNFLWKMHRNFKSPIL